MAGKETRRETGIGRFRVETATRTSRFTMVASVVVIAVLVSLPAFASRGLIQDMFFVLTMLVLAQYWNLLAGGAGLVSVGQQAFVGLGGYGLFAAVIVLGLDPLIAIPLAGVGALLVAISTAFLVFRLQGPHFAIGTWVIAEVCRLILAQVKILGGGTGTSLPPDSVRSMAGIEWVSDLLDLRASAARDVMSYWLALALALVSMMVIYRFLVSRAGLALAATRDSEPAAASVGVDTRRIRILVYIATAFGTGMAGAIMFLQTARISPDAAFSVLDWTAYVFFIVVIGGVGTLEGPIIGVIVLYFLRDYLSDFGAWYLILLGALAMAVMLVAPTGLWGLFSRRFDVHLFPTRWRLVTSDIKNGTEVE
jgi:branched-chain amino acid transport system permease protein